MREFKLSKIWILSDIEKTANVFTFGPRMNLITSQKNSVGKSSLVKSLLWTFGCEPYFDSAWKAQDVSCKIDFIIDDIEYTIFRNSNTYLIIKEDNYYYFDNFRKYVDFFCNLVNFFPMLENRNSKILELPSPVYYFIPFYIDQKKGWAQILNSFQKLTQYQNWQKNILNYHCGVTNNTISEMDYKISKKKHEIKLEEEERIKAENAIQIVSGINDENNFINLNNLEINRNLNIIDNKYEKIIEDQNNILTQINIEKNILIDLQSQKKYSEKLVNELTHDFFYVTENLTSETIECPFCGTNHNNTIIEKSKLIKEKDDLIQFISKIDIDINLAQTNLNILKENLIILGNDLANLHRNISLDTTKLIDCATTQRSINLIENKTAEIIESKNKSINSLEIDISNINQDKKLVNNKFTRNEIILEFQQLFREMNNFLSTDYSEEIISKSDIHSYNLFDTNGGAADSTRSIFLYHSILIQLIQNFSNEYIAPFIIDTPNQQEQAKENYEKIINTFFNKLPNSLQIFLCAMEHPALNNLKENVTIIKLESYKSLLSKNKYLDIKDQFDIFKNKKVENTILTY
ncbi:Uncharacterised protein [Acinetobacter baumannii]|uniref:hypothetical protein n=1 Tax=Acinetobacter baumannii TaxID=470 RepID=UPI000DE66196|nr:hypothetical protein [Acinetobacter baumannii]MBJ9580572.1 hypothetical protein [Acinetobacter baumannii]SSS46789.1 Uncharacterised protein [Acinetobacter baumannii]